MSRAARQAGISSKLVILDLMAERSAQDIKEQEDQRFLKEVSMLINQSPDGQEALDVGAMRTTAKKMKRSELIKHFIRCAQQLSGEKGLTRVLQKGTAQRDDELNQAHKLLEFWRIKAFQFQAQVNDLMSLIEERGEKV